MTMPETLAAAEAKATALQTENVELKANTVKLAADLAASNAALEKSKAEAIATVSALSAEINTLKTAAAQSADQIASLKSEVKTSEARAVEMLAKVGQTPPVPAVERTAAAAPSAKPLTGLARAIAAAKAAVLKN